jgi:cytochrome oxidase Cu insertion factor (SCO1/SenC/PrrC family)
VIRTAALGVAVALLLGAPAFPHEEHGATEAEPPLLFEPPAPGTYELPPIQRVSDRMLLDSSGERAHLLDLSPGEAAVVSFVYRGCADAQGCPLSLAVLRTLDRKLAALPELGARVRLVTVSFDPEHDTPERMAELRAVMAPRADWRFLTASSEGEIAELLEDFGQDAVRTPSGEATGRIRHVLKVFLVDGRGAVRNVYSAGFLDARILLADLETVLRPSGR